jgi:hypothetical protein
VTGAESNFEIVDIAFNVIGEDYYLYLADTKLGLKIIDLSHITGTTMDFTYLPFNYNLTNVYAMYNADDDIFVVHNAGDVSSFDLRYRPDKPIMYKFVTGYTKEMVSNTAITDRFLIV